MARPLSTKHPLHMVLKANGFLLFKQREIRTIFARVNKRFGMKAYQLAIHEDHIHTIIRIHNRNLYKKWIRALCSLLAGLGFGFIVRPYTRILSWGREFKLVRYYILNNQLEGNLILFAHKRLQEWTGASS